MLRTIPFLPIIFANLFAVACQSEANGDIDEIANIISDTVILPSGSMSPESYSQYFYKNDDQTIDSVFIIQMEEFADSVRIDCEMRNSELNPCSSPDFRVVGPGEQRWVQDPDDLPLRLGGGGSYIFIRYDENLGEFLSVECNGPY